MATINFAHREITAKVVYFGPQGAGTSTNVRKLFNLLPTQERSKLHEFGPEGETESTWYFDYVPEGGGVIAGFSTRFRVYALPGGLRQPDHQAEMLRAPDAVVFVADARPDRAESNMQALITLERALNDQGLDIAALPMVLQVNHTDAPDARPTDRVVLDLNPYGFPVVSAVALHATGVLETHDLLMRAAMSRLEDRISGNETALSLTAVHRETRERDDDVISRHIQAISEAERRRREHAQRSTPRPPSQYARLPAGPEIELPFQTPELVGTIPVHVLECGIDGTALRLDVVVSRVSGEEERRVSLRLVARPMDGEGVLRSAANDDASPSATPILPKDFEWSPQDPDDLSPMAYGLLGVLGGAVAGALLGYLLFA